MKKIKRKKISIKGLTNSEYIAKCRMKYGNTFGLDKINYISGETRRITIECFTHGDISVYANSFLNEKYKCPKCVELKRVNYKKTNFINKCKKKYGDYYSEDHLNSMYDNDISCITCSTHGIVNQSLNDFLRYECKKCFNSDVINEAKSIHSDSCSYSDINIKPYNNDFRILGIKCKDHGKFNMLLSDHIKKGCMFCDYVKRHDNIESIVVEAHKFLNNTLQYTLKCKHHGNIDVFDTHIRKDYECPECFTPFNGSVGINEKNYFIPYLNKLLNNISIKEQYKVVCHNYGNFDIFYIDAYIPELKLAIEYDENYHKYKKVNDLERENKIKRQLKCNFIRIDDNEFMNNNDYCYNVLKEYFDINNHNINLQPLWAEENLSKNDTWEEITEEELSIEDLFE